MKPMKFCTGKIVTKKLIINDLRFAKLHQVIIGHYYGLFIKYSIVNIIIEMVRISIFIRQK